MNPNLPWISTLPLAFFFFCYITPLTALLSGSQENLTSVSQAFWQLEGLGDYVLSRSPYAGGQNFTYCCLLAVNETLDIVDGSLVIKDGHRDWIANTSAADLLAASDKGLFPCGASYTGDKNGSPVVQVPWQWFADKCPGWQLNSKDNLNAWLQPLSGFLLPAVVFCLSVPRRRKIHVFRGLFVADLAGFKSYLPAIFGAIGALLLVTLDTTIWLCICFAFAGPMILSGLYEALLDNRILEFMRVKIREKKLTTDMRCRLLMLILIGNLDLVDEEAEDHGHPHRLSAFSQRNEPGPRGEPSMDQSDNGPLIAMQSHGTYSTTGAQFPPQYEMQLAAQSAQQQDGAVPSIRIPDHGYGYTSDGDNSFELRERLAPSRSTIARPLSSETRSMRSFTRRPTDQLRASPWRHMEELLYDIRLFDDEDTNRSLSPRQYPKHRCANGMNCRDLSHNEQPYPRSPGVQKRVNRTKTRLRTMLHCQYSFGSVVGAPVIFFLGGFVFAVLQSLEGLGDEDIAEGIAFGQWYMTIPHIAIVSGLLLAGNNPNILEGVFATERDETGDDIRIFGINFELAYASCYRTAWQWRRGHTKRMWLDKVIRTYSTRVDADYVGNFDHDDDLDDLRAVTTMAPLDWFLILFLTTILLGMPFTLAFLTSFYTPEVGLSCRSLTFTIYLGVQVAQVLLWLWAYAGPTGPLKTDGRVHPLNVFRRGGWLDRNGFYQPSSTAWLIGDKPNWTPYFVWQLIKSRRFWTIKAFWCVLYYGLATVFGFVGISAALGGTVMQLIGVYHSDICYVTADQWFKPYDQRSYVVISDNSKEMIDNAERFWRPFAITAIVFMTVVSFVGWWYQRRMRDLFTDLVRKLDLPQFDSPEVKLSRPLVGRTLPGQVPPTAAFTPRSITPVTGMMESSAVP